MERLMRRFALLGLFGLTQLSALGGCGDFGVTVDYLYWKPANYVGKFGGGVVREGEGEKSFVSNANFDPTYQSGVRGEIWWRPNCGPLSLIGRYYWVEPGHSQEYVGESSAVSGSIEVVYHAADLLLAYQFCLCNCFHLDFLAGGQVLYDAVNANLNIFFVGGDQRSRREAHSRLAGGGGSLGLAGAWNVWCGLHAIAEARYGVIFGSCLGTRVEVEETPDPGITVRTPTSFQVWTRELDLRLGGRYDWKCGCNCIGLELGWETRSYLDHPRFEDGFELPGELRSFGKSIGGPFIGLTGAF
jgi:Legionella pneumophila major outer membrane protein precursor